MTAQQDSGSPDFGSSQSPSPLKTSTESQVSQVHLLELLWELSALLISVLTVLVTADAQASAKLELQFRRLKQIWSSPAFFS